MISLVLAASVGAADIDTALNGDVKTFIVATFPYDSLLMPDGAQGQGIAAARAKLKIDFGESVGFLAHHELSFASAPARSQLEVKVEELSGQSIDTGTPSFGSGVGLEAPEAIPLTWEAVPDDPLAVRGRTDRLVLTGTLGPVDIGVGRQPVTFGNGMFFTPMDLVAPFNPAVIDQEYKPGVDAARVDVFAGVSGRVTAVAAYAGDWDLPGTILAVQGQGTVGVTDISGIVAEVRGDHVVGAGVWSSLGPVGVWADATLTVPYSDHDPFVRGVVGSQFRPTGTTTVAVEGYLQTLGASSPEGYEQVALSPWVQRGEIWLLAKGYGSVSMSQEITPLIAANLAAVVNPIDPSALLVASAAVSVSESSDLVFGAFYGAGERPSQDAADPLGLLHVLHSEFGLYPAAAYVEMKAYF